MDVDSDAARLLGTSKYLQEMAFFFFKRYQRNIMCFNQIAEKSGISLFVSKIADFKREPIHKSESRGSLLAMPSRRIVCEANFLICFYDSRNGLFPKGRRQSLFR